MVKLCGYMYIAFGSCWKRCVLWAETPGTCVKNHSPRMRHHPSPCAPSRMTQARQMMMRMKMRLLALPATAARSSREVQRLLTSASTPGSTLLALPATAARSSREVQRLFTSASTPGSTLLALPATAARSSREVQRLLTSASTASTPGSTL